MALRRMMVPGACAIALLLPSPAVAAERARPNLWHGIGQIVSGVLFELPATVLRSTTTGPPVVGTMLGLLAGTSRAVQKTASGLAEVVRVVDAGLAEARR